MATSCAAYANAAALHVWQQGDGKSQKAVVNDTIEIQAGGTTSNVPEKEDILRVESSDLPALSAGDHSEPQPTDEGEELPSAAQRTEPRVHLEFGPNLQLQTRQIGQDRSKFPPGRVAQQIETEFDDGDSDVFLDKIREDKASKLSRSSRKRKLDAAKAVRRDVAEENEVEALADVEAQDSPDLVGRAGHAASSRKGKEKATEKDIGAGPARRSRRKRVRNSPSTVAGTLEDHGRGGSTRLASPPTASAEDVTTLDQEDGGTTGAASSASRSGKGADEADFEENLDEEELQRRQEEAREQRKRLKALEKERARIDAELASVRATSVAKHSELQRKSRTPVRRLNFDFSDSEAPVVRDEKGHTNTKQGTMNRYATGGNRNGRVAWTPEETHCLIGAIDKLYDAFKLEGNLQGNHSSQIYTRILNLHGPQGSISRLLANRNNLQLKDKVRNEIRRLRRNNDPDPVWKDTFFPNM
jgi:hypothetical protein